MEKQNKTGRRNRDRWKRESEWEQLRNLQESLSQELTLHEEEMGLEGEHSPQKNRCKGFSASYLYIFLILQLCKANCPKKHSEELVCSFLEGCLTQSLCFQLLCSTA